MSKTPHNSDTEPTASTMYTSLKTSVSTGSQERWFSSSPLTVALVYFVRSFDPTFRSTNAFAKSTTFYNLNWPAVVRTNELKQLIKRRLYGGFAGVMSNEHDCMIAKGMPYNVSQLPESGGIWLVGTKKSFVVILKAR